MPKTMEHTGKIMLIMTYNDPLVVARVVANKKTGELTPAKLRLFINIFMQHIFC